MLFKHFIFFCLLTLLSQTVEAQLIVSQTEPFYGTASYYAQKFQGRRTANGEKFSQDSLTAAHKTLPFGTLVKVTNRQNNQWIIVRINDRMSLRARHIIDLTKKGAKMLNYVKHGHTEVSLEVIPTFEIAEEMLQLEADSLPVGQD